MVFKREKNETVTDFVNRICSMKSEIGSWDEIRTILNKCTGYNFTESTWRKKYSRGEEFPDNDFYGSIEDSKNMTLLNEQIIELRKERAKFQTEKLEYNRWLRENARDELIFEHIDAAIKNLKPIETPKPIKLSPTKKEYLLVFGDCHYGSEFKLHDLFGEVLNEYSPEIFEKRMNILLCKTFEYIKKENIQTLNVFDMGDFADGILRVSQLMKLRYGIVESTIKYSEFICNWLTELSKHVHVKFRMVEGNHTELRMLGQPKGTFTNENMSKIVAEFIKIRTKDNSNITFLENKTGLIFAQIACSTVLAFHGEAKNMEKAKNDFSNMYGVNIDYVISGHVHHNKSEETGKRSEVINVGSIMGMDDYAVKLGKSSSASAKILTFDVVDGLINDYRIYLN